MPKISFSLRQILAFVFCVCLLLGIWEVIFIVFSEPQIPARTNIIRMKYKNSKTPPYRVGGVMRCAGIAGWLKNSKMSRAPVELISYCELTFLDFNNELFKLRVFQDNDSTNRNTLYFMWEGRCRAGPFDEFKSVLEANSQVLDSRNCRYEDRNEDGEVDTKIQFLDSKADLIWEDSNYDGIFDKEYLFDNSRRQKVYSTAIRISTPGGRKATQGQIENF